MVLLCCVEKATQHRSPVVGATLFKLYTNISFSVHVLLCLATIHFEQLCIPVVFGGLTYFSCSTGSQGCCSSCAETLPFNK